MTLSEIIASFREETDDKEAPHLWSNSYLTLLANEAQMEAVRRARLLEDAETAAICTYPVKAGTRFIVPDKRVIFVRSVRIASTNWRVPKIHARDLEIAMPDWQTSDLCSPVVYCSNYTKGKIYFAPGFAVADTVQLQVVREPLSKMTLGSVTAPGVDPEIAERYQYGLINWMLFRAYSKQDSETYDEKKSEKSLALFENEFGKKSAAIDENWIEGNHGYDNYEGLF